MMDALTLLQSRLSPLLAEDMAQEVAQPFEGTCENCGRDAGQFGGLAYPVTDAYKDSYHQCPACRLLTVQAPKALGNERMAGSTPIGYKLSSFKGGYLVIPTEGTPELWLGGKYPEKLTQAKIKIVTLAGNTAKRALMERPQAQLVIDLSLRRERFTRYLSTGTAKALHIAGETGLTVVPYSGWPAFAQAWQALDKKARSEAIVVLRGVTGGNMASTLPRVQAFWQAHPDFTAACQQALPANPYARLFYVDAATTLEASA